MTPLAIRATREAFWRHVDEAAERVAKIPKSQRVDVGCDYIPTPYEITPEMIERFAMDTDE